MTRITVDMMTAKKRTNMLSNQSLRFLFDTDTTHTHSSFYIRCNHFSIYYNNNHPEP